MLIKLVNALAICLTISVLLQQQATGQQPDFNDEQNLIPADRQKYSETHRKNRFPLPSPVRYRPEDRRGMTYHPIRPRKHRKWPKRFRKQKQTQIPKPRTINNVIDEHNRQGCQQRDSCNQLLRAIERGDERTINLKWNELLEKGTNDDLEQQLERELVMGQALTTPKYLYERDKTWYHRPTQGVHQPNVVGHSYIFGGTDLVRSRGWGYYPAYYNYYPDGDSRYFPSPDDTSMRSFMSSGPFTEKPRAAWMG